MSVTIPREELSNLLHLARELAQMMGAEQNADDENLVEVRLLRAVERVDRHIQECQSALVLSTDALQPRSRP